jgi:hypothetical protein
MKKQNILKTLLLAMLFLPVFAANAQYDVKQVIVASGGIFGPTNKVGVGSYDPATKKFTSFDSVPGRSVTQLLIDTGEIAFLATDSTLVKYDLSTLKPIKTMQVFGLRYMALYNDYVVAAIGEDGNFNHFKMFRKSDLSLVYNEKNIPGYSEGITVAGDTAYVAVQGDYPFDSGRVAIIDLVNHKLVKVLNLGKNAKGIGQMFASKNYVLGTSEYYGTDTTYISKIDLKTRISVVTLAKNVSNAFNLSGDSMYAMLKGGFGSYNVKTNTSRIIVKSAPAYGAGAYDTANKIFYLTGLDYGKATMSHVYDSKGNAIDSFEVGPSAQAIGIDYMKKKSGINNGSNFGYEVQLFPNPAKTEINILGFECKNADVKLTDITGKTVYHELKDLSSAKHNSIPLENVTNGLYILTIKSAAGTYSGKFVKN